jgi:hypothetical protein
MTGPAPDEAARQRASLLACWVVPSAKANVAVVVHVPVRGQLGGVVM